MITTTYESTVNRPLFTYGLLHDNNPIILCELTCAAFSQTAQHHVMSLEIQKPWKWHKVHTFWIMAFISADDNKNVQDQDRYSSQSPQTQ